MVGSQRSLILGIGNTIRGDDAVGILIARELKNTISDQNIVVEEVSELGLNLVDLASGFSKLIIIDSIKTANGKAGYIHKLDPNNFKRGQYSYSTHKLGLPTLIEMAKTLNLDLPEEIVIYAVEIEKNDEFEEKLSLSVQNSIPRVINMLKNELNVQMKEDL